MTYVPFLFMLAPQQATPTSSAEHPAEADAQYYRAALHELIDVGLDLARTLRPSPTPAPEPAPKPAEPPSVAYDRISRAVRRSIMLAQQVAQARPAPTPSQRRTAARREILRTVGDAIEDKRLKPEQAETLHAELNERLDRPELEEDIRHRPIGELIAEIRRDLGLDNVPGVRAFKRRTPADLAALHTRAAQPPRPGTASKSPLPLVGLGRGAHQGAGEGGIASRRPGVCGTSHPAPPRPQQTAAPQPPPPTRTDPPAIPPDIVRPPKVEREHINGLIRRLSPNSS